MSKWQNWIGKKVFGRRGGAFENVAGVVTNVRSCRMAGCTGIALCVKWPDGKRTFPCTKGCTEQADGSLRIGD